MEDGADDGVLEIVVDGKTRRYRPPWRIYPDLTSRDWKMFFQLRECYVDERFPFAEQDAAGGFTQHAGKAHYPDVVQWAISNISADVDVDFVDTLMKEILAKLEAYDLVMAVDDEFLVLGPDVLTGPEFAEDDAEQSDSEGEEDFFDAGEFFVSSLDDNDAEAKEDERRFARNPFKKMLADQAASPNERPQYYRQPRGPRPKRGHPTKGTWNSRTGTWEWPQSQASACAAEDSDSAPEDSEVPLPRTKAQSARYSVFQQQWTDVLP